MNVRFKMLTSGMVHVYKIVGSEDPLRLYHECMLVTIETI